AAVRDTLGRNLDAATQSSLTKLKVAAEKARKEVEDAERDSRGRPGGGGGATTKVLAAQHAADRALGTKTGNARVD
ncbi:MAG: hypothetical protein AAGC46_17050, partial [Solirubrobacteraceae bacterium]|nr:hypothetical protein [Patulibacter sp.]